MVLEARMVERERRGFGIFRWVSVNDDHALEYSANNLSRRVMIQVTQDTRELLRKLIFYSIDLKFSFHLHFILIFILL